MARSPTAAETKSASCAAVPTFDSRDPFPHAASSGLLTFRTVPSMASAMQVVQPVGA
jgi:hypothetical protein